MANYNTKKSITVDLPFDEKKTEALVGQGFNGPFSHRKTPGIDLSYSVDFVVPVGTEVLAVQDGIVRSIERSTDCYRGLNHSSGRRNFATSIEIFHPQYENGNVRVYSMLQHLNPNSIRVTAGQKITRGQILACTGLTGWVGPIPHLHISMAEDGKRPHQTIPFNFRNYQGPLDDNDVAHELATIATFQPERVNEIIEARKAAYAFMAAFR